MGKIIWGEESGKEETNVLSSSEEGSNCPNFPLYVHVSPELGSLLTSSNPYFYEKYRKLGIQRGGGGGKQGRNY